MRTHCVHPVSRPCWVRAAQGCCVPAATRSRPRLRRHISRAFRTCCRLRRRSLRCSFRGCRRRQSARWQTPMRTTELPRPRSSRRCVRSARPRGQRSPSGAIAWGASSRAIRRASTPRWTQPHAPATGRPWRSLRGAQGARRSTLPRTCSRARKAARVRGGTWAGFCCARCLARRKSTVTARGTSRRSWWGRWLCRCCWALRPGACRARCCCSSRCRKLSRGCWTRCCCA